MPQVRRAYSVLTVKSVDDEQRIIEGVATTPTTDRMGDVVEPDGAQFSLPMPLLWQHQSSQPIGQVLAARVTDAGIQIRAQIAKGLDIPWIDDAWKLVKSGLVRGLSIGFTPIEAADITGTWGQRFIKWDWHELSAVTIPANADASIQTVKSFDIDPAASGSKSAVVRLTSPGVSGRSQDTQMRKPIADQIKDWEASRAAKSARMSEIQSKAADESRGKDEKEREEFDTLDTDIKSVDRELADLRKMEAIEKAAAAPVRGTDPDEGSRSRAPRIVVGEKHLPPGIGFARLAMCVAKARGSMADAMAFAKDFYPDDSRLFAALKVKAAVGAGVASGSSHWAEDLVPYNILQNDFIEYLRAGNIVDKFGTANPGGGGNYPTLRRVPFNVRVSGFSAGLTGNWVGEGKPSPVSKATSFNATLTWAKVEALAVLTNEEVRFSNPSAEMKVRDDIARAINTRIDLDFVDPGNPGTAGVKPASITDSIVATAPTAATAAALITDLTNLIKPFGQNNLDVSDIVLIMSAQQALNISMMTTTLGMPYFPDITMKGGTLRGFPVLVSENLTSVGSPSTNTIVAVKSSEIYLADDGNVTVDASDQASLEMLDGSLTQDGTAGTGASLVSLWQNGLLGIKASREITWKLRRSTAVQYISPAAYAA